MTVVCNSSPLIAFQSIDGLHILKQLFGTILIPEAVYAEVFSKQKACVSRDVVPNFITVKTVSDRNLVKTLEMQLDRGESEAVVLAIETGVNSVLIDDKPARQVADRLGLKVVGVVGILILAKQKRIIPEVRPLITEMMEKINFRIDKSLLNKVLNIVNEMPV